MGTENFQARASQHGRAFEVQASLTLAAAGLDPQPGFAVPEAGIDADFTVVTPSGRLVAVEAKGSYLGDRPGMRRTDTARKAMADAWALRHLRESRLGGHGWPAYAVITTHRPTKGTALAMLDFAEGAGAALVVEINQTDLAHTLDGWAERTRACRHATGGYGDGPRGWRT